MVFQRKDKIILFSLVALVGIILLASLLSSGDVVSEDQLRAELKTLSDEELTALASGDSGAIAGLATKRVARTPVAARASPAQVAAAARQVQASSRSVAVKKSSSMMDVVAANARVRSQAGRAGYAAAQRSRDQAMSASWENLRLADNEKSKITVVSNGINLGCLQLQAELEKNLGNSFPTEIRDMPASCFTDDIIRDQLFYEYCDEVTSLRAKDGVSMPGWVPAQKIARQSVCLSEKQTAKLSAALRSGTNTVLGTLNAFGYENAQGNFLNLMLPAYLLIYDVDKHRGKDSGLYQLFKEHKQKMKDEVRSKGWATEKMMLYDRVSGQLVGAPVCKGNARDNCASPSALLNSLRPGALNDGHCQFGDMVQQGSKVVPETGEESYSCPTSLCGGGLMDPMQAGAAGGAAPGKQADAAKGPGFGAETLGGQWGAEATGSENTMAQSLCGSLANPGNGGFAGMGIFGDESCLSASVFPSDADIAAGRVQNQANQQRSQMVACIGAADAREQAAGAGALQPGQRRDTMSLQRGNPLSGGCGLASDIQVGRVKLDGHGTGTQVNKYFGKNMDSTTTITTKFADGKVDKIDTKTDYVYQNEDGSSRTETHSSSYDGEGKCTSGCDEPDLSQSQAKAAAEDAEKAAAEAKEAKGTGASSCADPDSCSSSCTGANEQASFSGDCMGSQAAQDHPGFAGAQQGPGRAGPVSNPGAPGADRNPVNRDAAAAGSCRAMGSGSDNVCAQVMCGESSNMAANTGMANVGGMAVSEGGRAGTGSGGGRGAPRDSIGVTGNNPARNQALLNSLACCGIGGVNLQRQMTLNRGCEVMRCANEDNGGDCSCTGSPDASPNGPGLEAGGGLGGEGGPAAARR
ncbi:hypothetical protein HYV86_04395 [Candidatus Woesearchaeota archaeon]|nr:hypothetical protein [Candidatus Woesearchaeota archaeon]